MADLLYGVLKTVLGPLADAYFDLRAAGVERLPAGAYILAANHSSLLDWVFVARPVPRPVRFVLSREFYDQPFLRPIYRGLGVVPIRDRRLEVSAVRQLLATLARGEIVGFFPEGRITRDGSLARAERGVVALAARARVAIVPAGVRGAFEAFPRDARWPRRHPVRISFGEPLPVPPAAATDRGAQARLAAELMRRIDALRAHVVV
jgi:1-acyl-sn-glycerol-3-phosphate acyltransferase